MRWFYKETQRKVVAAMLVASFAFPVFFLNPEKAQAFITTFDVGLNPVFDTIIVPATIDIALSTDFIALNTDALTGTPSSDVKKKYLWDFLINAAVKAVLLTMLNDVVVWAQTGFEGGPAFVTDPAEYLKSVGDITAGAIIEEIAPILCSPFRASIVNALSISGGRSFGKISCTLSEVVDNIDDFLDGNFSAGGWDGWFSMTQNSANNPYGLYAEATLAIHLEVTGRQSKELKLLDFGKGFFSWSECITYGEVDGQPGCVAYSDIQTPGSVVEAQINSALGSPGRQLEIANEINQAVSAVVVALVQKLLSAGLSAIR